MAAGRQLRLLLWKDYLIRKRNVITLAGVIWGLCVMSSLYIVRINIDNQDFPSCQFPARALPSAGILTFMQSFICSVDNTCSPLDQFNEIPSYEKSKLTEVKRQIWPLMNNATVVNVAEVIPDAIKLLSTLAQVADNPTFLDISKNGLHVRDLFKNPSRVRRYIAQELDIEEDVANSIVEAEISLDGIMQGSIDRCDVNSIAKVIKVENKDHVEVFVSKICILSKKVLQKLVTDLFLEVNIGKYVKMAGDMYYRMSGDDRISRIGDMTTAVLRMMSMKNFLPTELSSVLNNEDVDFSYVNLTMITQALDLFQPTFGETDAYKTIRDVADVSVIGFQYLYKIWKRQSNNTVEEVTDLAVMNVRKFDVDKELDKLTNVFKEAIAMIEDLSSGNGVDNLFNVLSKASNFIYKFLSGRTRHNFLFYLTLMTKLVEGAEQAVIINMNIEQVVYNVSKRNPDGVKVLLSLPPDLVSKGLEALADPERVQLLTDKIDDPKKMFCEVNQIHSFFSIPRAEASKLIVHLCTDAWNNYITDMITSFGIFEMRDNINSIASLFILETIGRDTTEYLYPIDKDFEIYKNFTRTLAKIESHKVPNLNWSRVLGIDEDSEIMKKVREKTFLGNQVLITVNGALAKEVIKQNPLLEYKISPPFRDATTLLLAINEQLKSVPEDVTRRARELYPRVVEMILLTALNEDKTYRALSTPSEEIFCNGVENAASYLELPPVDVEALVSTLCDISAIINTGLQRESIFGNAIAEVKNTTHGPLDDIDWSLLIGALKDLYLKLDKVYPYIFQYKTYGMDDVMQKHVDEMVMTAKDFWFSKKNINRSMHVSMKFILRLLDVVDCGAFNITSEKWLMLKYGVSSAMGPLAATGDFIKLLGAISRRDDTVSEVPHTTAVALTQFLQNMPQLVVDATDVIVRGDTDVEPIIEVMNAEPPWPCGNRTLAVPLSERSQEALRGLETIFCMDRQLQEEWVNYFEEKNIASIQSEDWNTTTYQPHLFLKFSAVFTSAVEDLDALKDFLQSLFDDSEGVSFASSIDYAIEAFNVSDKDAILRNFFSKLDTVLTAINTSSVDQAVPLNTLWRNYFQCSSGQYIEEYCWRSGRAAWKLTLQFLSVALGNMAEDLLTYFRETNEPNTDVLKLFGFTSNTGLYALYDKFPEFVGVLLNSYWDLGFMNQVRRASLSQFWDCDALLGALTPPPGSPVDDQLIHRVAPFICPSLLHWISLPRGDNILLDVIAKPQYFFFTILASELNSTYENAYLKTTELANFVSELANKTLTDFDDSEDNKENKRGKQSSLDKMRTKLERNVDKMLSFELTEDNPSYRLFNEANKKQFISSIYLTRITAIINKLSKALESLKVNETGVELSEDDLKKAATELTAIQKIFKRRPTEVVAVHFDVLTDVLWSNDVNYKLTDAMTSMCDNMENKDNTKDILSDTDRVKLQICSKKFEQFYRAVEIVVDEDYEDARTSLLVLVDILQNGENREVIDIFKFLNERKQIVKSLKTSITYAYDLGIPIYLQYLHSNIQQYYIVISFLSGDDWWGDLRRVYSGPRVTEFIDSVEHSFDIADDVLNNLDKIHLVRLLRDMNMNSTEAFCRSNVTLKDYIPDGTEILSKLKHQACNNNSELVREIPPLLFASQGYAPQFKLSEEVNYTKLYSDLSNTESKLTLIKNGPSKPMRPKWITDEKIAQLRESTLKLLSKETLTKVSFGVLSNVVDAGTLFLNNSQCTVCSQLTAWFKQINLQLYKKQEYDTLLCHMDPMTLSELHHSLKNDFHWDMAISELISTRNYTKYELNKSLHEFVELVKLHLLDDVTGDVSKVALCLNSNVTGSAMGNVTLFANVLARTIRLFRAELPHLQEVSGFKNLKYFKELHAAVAHNLHVKGLLKNYLKKDYDLYNVLVKIVKDKRIVEDIEGAKVNLRKIRELRPADEHIKLKHYNWTVLCATYDCDGIVTAIGNSINQTQVDNDLPKLQDAEFWRFGFIADILGHEERLLGDMGRLLGVVSTADLEGVLNGELVPLVNFVMQLMMDESLDSVLYSLRGILEELQPILAGTPLEFDVNAISTGLGILREYKTYLMEEDINVEVSRVLVAGEQLERELRTRGINNSAFWDVAAPRLQSAQLRLAPILAPKQGAYNIENFVCQVQSMAEVLIPGDVNDVSLDDIYGAVVDQFCGLSDQQAKEILSVLLQNLNYSLILDKVKTIIVSKLYEASNLSQSAGERVMASMSAAAATLPTLQQDFTRLTDILADEPLLQTLKNSTSVNTLVSSSSFLSDAGSLVCGRSLAVDAGRYYKVVASARDASSQPDQLQLDALPTDFCRSLYKEIVSIKGGKIVWRFAKPLIIGKILYTPDTPAVRRIIEKANATFAPMVQLTNLIHSFADAFSYIETLTEHRDGMSALASLLTSSQYAGLRKTLLGDVEIGDLDVDDLMDGLSDIEGYKNMVRKASDLLHCINMNRFQPARDEDHLKLEAGRLSRINEFSAGLVFLNAQDGDEALTNIEYKIRMDIENAPTTKRLRNYLWIPGPEASFMEDMRYFRGFVQIQDIIDKAIIELSAEGSRRVQKREAAEENDWDWAVYTQQTPYPCYRKDFFQTTLYESQSLMVAFFFSMLFTVTSAVRFIVADKESGNTMLMSIMGVDLRYHTLSWFLLSFAEMTVTVAAMTAMLYLGHVLPRTDPSLLFALLFLYGFSVMTFCYMMSKMFKAASFAAVCTGLAVLSTYMPFILILSLEGVLNSSLKILVCLSMSSAMIYGMWFVTRFEAMGLGAHWGMVWDTMEGSEMTLAYAMLMVFVDALIYAAIGYLLDWCFGFKVTHNNIECSSSGEKAGVSIVNVTKVYQAGGRRAKLALDNVSMELEKGQITTLLGHNGAGKTTLINILTGMAKATKGHVVVRTEAGTVSRVGVCPQRDVLLDYMTAREHVALYAQLKSGRPLHEVKDEVESILSVLSLGGIAEVAAARLSGGTRRRLCVALAFVARPSLVSLDEPTSGVDPKARREIWSMIMKLRENRTILMTTHHLDEAELLSDQIVIMHKGQIHTTGSPIDIKRSLGNGYKLTVMYPDRRLHIHDEDLPQEDISIEEKTKQLLAVTRTVVKNANLVDINGSEVEINLPFFDADGVSNNFLAVCKALERGAATLAYRSFALDCSSLEHVFFNICRTADAHHALDYETSGSAETASKSASSSSARADRTDREPLVPREGPTTGTPLQQFLALFYARYLHYVRNKWLLFMLIILPSLFVAIAMAFSTIRPPADTEISLKLHRGLYEPTTDFLVPQPSVYSKNMDDTFARNVIDILQYEQDFRNWTTEDSPSCQCVDTVHRCDLKNYTADRPQMMLLPDVHTLNNWLVDSQPVYIEKRYGGFTSVLKDNVSHLVAWYNNKGHHALPVYVNAVNTAALRAASGRPRANITLYTHPLKISNEQLSKATAYQHIADAGVSCMLLIGYSLVSAAAAIYLVGARRNQEKRLQLLSGLSPALYWTAALAWDLIVSSYIYLVGARRNQEKRLQLLSGLSPALYWTAALAWDLIVSSYIYLVGARRNQEKRLQLLSGLSPALYWTAALAWDLIVSSYIYLVGARRNQEKRLQLLSGLSPALYWTAALAWDLIVSSYIYLVGARRNQEKRLQLLSGLSPALYWTAALAWDLIVSSYIYLVGARRNQEKRLQLLSGLSPALYWTAALAWDLIVSSYIYLVGARRNQEKRLQLLSGLSPALYWTAALAWDLIVSSYIYLVGARRNQEKRLQLLSGLSPALYWTAALAWDLIVSSYIYLVGARRNQEKRLQLLSGLSPALYWTAALAWDLIVSSYIYLVGARRNQEKRLQLLSGLSPALYWTAALAWDLIVSSYIYLVGARRNQEKRLQLLSGLSPALYWTAALAWDLIVSSYIYLVGARRNQEKRLQLLSGLSPALYWTAALAWDLIVSSYIYLVGARRNQEKRLQLLSGLSPALYWTAALAWDLIVSSYIYLVGARRNQEKRLQLLSGLSPALYWTAALAWDLIVSSYIYLVGARRNQEKRLQLLSGLSPALYWTAALAWDLIVSSYIYLVGARRNQEKRLQLLSGLSPALYWTAALAWDLIVSSYIYLVGARRNQEKRLQLLSGLSPALYWTAALAWDLIIILINLVITVIVLGIFRFPVFVYGNNLPAICVLIILYGYACACLVHLLEKLFSEPSMANMVLFCGNTFVGVVGITVLLILDIISESETTDNARWVLHKVFLLSPQFTLGDGLLAIATNTIQALVLKQFGMDTYEDPLASTVTSYHYLSLVCVGTALFCLNLAVEYDCFEVVLVRFRRQPASLRAGSGEEAEEAAEVRAERVRVAGALAAAQQPMLLHTIANINAGYVETEIESKAASVKRSVVIGDVCSCEGLGKAYSARGRPAVCHLTLGVPPGQCTALLGQNEAGKSTTFSMLTGEVRPTAGKIYINSKPVDKRDLCKGLISYCPQSDAIDPLLTVTETLKIYCRLRGISNEKEVIRRTIEMFELTKYECVRSGSLSGGNKRKLCTAIAFMGRAPLVLLDEPTSGMDPASRACVSRGVRAACGAGRGVVLSTHALEDARRLAARVALVRAGRLCALAPLDDCLKRFGGGYVVACRVRAGSALSAWRAVRAAAPHAALRVLHQAALHFHLPTHTIVDKKEVTTQWSDVFELVAQLQATCEIEDYTVNQSSLDQMFLSFTEKTKEDLDLEDIQLEPISAAHLERRNSDELNSVTAL